MSPSGPAWQEAEAVLEAARAEAAELRRNNRAEGQRTGREEGLREGRAEARGECEALLAQARQVLDLARAERGRVMTAALGEVVDLALDIARRIVGRELTQSPEEVLQLARRLVARAGEGRVLVRAHPSEAGVLEGERQSLGPQVEVRADPAISPGGLVVESLGGIQDATLEARLHSVEAVVRSVSGQAESGGKSDAFGI